MDVVYYEKSDDTFYTPDLNVGISKYILGEYILDDNDVISGIELKIKELEKALQSFRGNQAIEESIRGNEKRWTQNICSDFFYTRIYNQEIFKEPIILCFNNNNILIKIYCKIKGDHKESFLHELERKYGHNRNYEWEINNLYRTEVFNIYGVIRIRYIFNKENNRASLEMYFTQLHITKPELVKIEKERKDKEKEEIRKQEEINKLKLKELENDKRLKGNIQDLFDF